MAYKMAYIPPNKRTYNKETEETTNHMDWLKELQKRHVHTVKTPAELATELATLTFEQLSKRAGPPPNVRADAFVWGIEGCGPAEREAGEPDFNGDLARFKRGLGPPPAPLQHNQPDAIVKAYCSWYQQWGSALKRAWVAEHPQLQKKTTPKPTPKQLKATEPEAIYVPKRVVAEAGEASGW